jgi:Cys-tRNA synthase (O-phospho-L-seryl-tRNA:Cys-tRNA synthase)
MITSSYLEKFVLKSVQKYVPEGIHPELHINCQAHMYEIIMTLIKEGRTPAKLSIVTYLSKSYKDILYSKYSQLN